LTRTTDNKKQVIDNISRHCEPVAKRGSWQSIRYATHGMVEKTKHIYQKAAKACYHLFYDLFRSTRTPLFIQMEIAECGAAALAIVLAHYGRYIPLAEARQACGVSRDGSKAINMLKAARKYGLKAQGAQVHEIDVLTELKMPFIVHWMFNHFVVVEEITEVYVYINDPAIGRRR